MRNGERDGREMDAAAIIGKLREGIRSELEAEELTVNGFMIHTGFTYPDGDELYIILSEDEGGWRFSDEGHTMMWLSYEDFNLTDSRRSMLDRTLKGNGVSMDRGELYIGFDADTVCDALRSMIQAEIQVADLLYLDKEIPRDTSAMGTQSP